MIGAVAVQVYDPSARVVLVTMLVLQLNTHTMGSFPIPPAFAVRVPEIVNVAPSPVEPGGDNAVSEVETGLDSEPVLRINVIVPGPFTETKITLLEPEHDNPLIQLQLEIE